MKAGYATAFLLTVIVLMYSIWKTGKSKRKIAGTVKQLLIAAVGTVLANLTALLSENEPVCLAAYSIFFMGIDWLLYYVLQFVKEYTGYERVSRMGRRTLRLVLALDSASMLLNSVFYHAFSCKPVQSVTGELYYRIDSYLFYNIHLALSYLLIVSVIVLLIEKIVCAPRMYRGKYVLVLAILAGIVLMDVAYVFLGQTVDVSILFFSVGGLAFYYLSIVYTPKKLLNSTLSMVVQAMMDAVLLFDVEGKCIYINESAAGLLGARDVSQVESEISAWMQRRELREQEEYGCDADLVIAGREYHLSVEYHRLADKKKEYIGNFLVIHDRTKDIEMLRQEHIRATRDKLTGLYNREYFYEKSAEYIREHAEETFLIVCSDVGNFKLVNDIFGVGTGDELLVNIAKGIKERTIPGEIYGRIGNDRFALLMRKKDYNEEAFIAGPKQVLKIDNDVSYQLNVYVGVYEVRNPEMPVSVMCDRAFMAANSIKGSYQKRVAYYDEHLRNSVLCEQEIVREATVALREGGFQIYLQPQITSKGKVTGAEALVRWIHPEKGVLAPGEFIEILEKNGMIVKLDQYVWELACMQLKKWKEEGHDDMYLSVNISTRDFYFVDVYRVLKGLVEKYGITPDRLRLEITETAVMLNLERQLELIQKLRDTGFCVEMDDFGSGYSSLNMLKNIQVDGLKVDMAFLERTGDEVRGRKILKMVIGMAKELELSVITEGVETEEQVAFLTEIGCDMFQGYYYAKPMPVDEFEARYMSRKAE